MSRIPGQAAAASASSRLRKARRLAGATVDLATPSGGGGRDALRGTGGTSRRWSPLVPDRQRVLHSFYNWNPGYTSAFVGLANYTSLAGSEVFREILSNEGVFLLGVPLWVLLPLAIALFLYERVPLAGLARTIIFYPSVAAPAIMGIFFRGILQPDGLLNTGLRGIGAGGLARNWLGDPNR